MCQGGNANEFYDDDCHKAIELLKTGSIPAEVRKKQQTSIKDFFKPLTDE